MDYDRSCFLPSPVTFDDHIVVIEAIRAVGVYEEMGGGKQEMSLESWL